MSPRAFWIFAALSVLSPTAVSHADPEVPQADTSCAPNLTDVHTLPPGQRGPLTCTAGRWQNVPAPADPSDSWASLGGAPMVLHGQGLRNPDVLSGDWTATPLEANSSCAATQRAVVSAGVVGAPTATEGAPGQRLSLTLPPTLFDISMSGYCLWMRTG